MEDQVVKWKRVHGTHGDDDLQVLQEGDKQQPNVQYASRLLTCTACGNRKETKQWQLWTTIGYRAIRCTACKRQERCARNLCQCGHIWHQCLTHRIDPPQRRAYRGSGSHQRTAKGRMQQLLPSSRKTPVCKQTTPILRLQIKRRAKRKTNTSQQANPTPDASGK